jgi:hypothetical protein
MQVASTDLMITAVQWRLSIIARLRKYIGFEVDQNSASVKTDVDNYNNKLRGDLKDISIGCLQNLSSDVKTDANLQANN